MRIMGVGETGWGSAGRKNERYRKGKGERKNKGNDRGDKVG